MVYGQFIRDLLDRGLVELVAETDSLLGVFFVSKKDGRMRLIFDTRIANAYFTEPPHTALPSTGARAQQELLPNQQTHFSGGDIECAFYRMEVPSEACRFMTLPPVRRKFVCSDLCIDGRAVAPDVFVSPRLRVLPMGWS